jgi:hypothetical protein
MLLDEIDTLMKADAEMAEALRGTMNSGFTRAGARFVKNVPTPDGGFAPHAFSTWCPMLLAGIGELPDTIADRSIIIEMTRKRPDEKVRRLRTRDGYELRELGRKAARWAADNHAGLEWADPVVPQQLNDRAADAWSPLLAIADLAGSDWPERAHRAAIELSDQGDDTEPPRVQLLADLRALFDRELSGVLFATEILTALHTREDRPWPEYRRGKPITASQMARLLRPLHVPTNKTVRRGTVTGKGYRAADLEDAWSRYLAPASADPSVTRSHVADSADLGGNGSGTPDEDVTDRANEKSSNPAGCDRVTDPEPLASDEVEAWTL